MINILIIILGIGAYLLLRDKFYKSNPGLKNNRLGYLIGVPVFYIAYSITEAVRLYNAGEAVFNSTGYQHLLSGTDMNWDMSVMQSAIDNMGSAKRTAMFYLSMAEGASQLAVLVTIISMGLFLYFLLNDGYSKKKVNPRVGIIITAVFCLIPYALFTLGFQNSVITVILLLLIGLFSWTCYALINAFNRYMELTPSRTQQSAYTTNSTQNNSEYKNCPYCGEQILNVAIKCKHCGEWLNKADSPSTSVPLKKNCLICGEEIDADATVCPYCDEPVEAFPHEGNGLSSLAQAADTNHDNNTSKKTWIIAAIVLAVLFIGYFLLKSGDTKSGQSNINTESLWNTDDGSTGSDDDFLIN